MSGAPACGAGADALARLEEEMRRPPLHGFLRPQAHAVSAQTGEVVIRLPFRPEFGRDPVDIGYHGGILASLIDLAAHAAVAVRIGKPAPTIDLRIDYLRPAPGVELEARARVLRAGRAIARADVDVLAGGILVAVGRGTFSAL